MTLGPGVMPWRLTAVGLVLVLLTAFVGGFAVAYWMGGSGWRRTVSPTSPTSAPAAPTPVVSPVPKAVAAPAPAPVPQLPPPVPAALKRPRPEPTPASAPKPRTQPATPTQADVDACARYATVQAEEHDKAAEDDQDRKADDAYQKAYASCLQARGGKKARADD